MQKLEIHTPIKDKLAYFHSIHKIPHIIFHGLSGNGKSALLNDFISMIYDYDKEMISNFTMFVNCSHGKGIKFIRDELKFFAKIQISAKDKFKSIVLFNADKLTTDAQSSLRRCIEIFSNSTRFFMIVEDKYKLLNPILSRFCEIYVPEPIIHGKPINLYRYQLDKKHFFLKDAKTRRMSWLKKELNTFFSQIYSVDCLQNLMALTTKLTEKAYSLLDIIQLLENNWFQNITSEKRQYELLLSFDQVRKEIRNENILIYFALYFIYIGNNVSPNSIDLIF